jgi:hypothetical protein
VGHAKGTTLLGTVKYLRQRRTEALAILPPALHGYLDERIRTSSWYPEADLLELIRATARLVSGPTDQVLEIMGETTAREHAEVYGGLLNGASTSRAFAIWSTQHDTGELRMTEEGPSRVRFEIVGYEDPSREMCLVSQGYIKGVMVMNGASDLSVEKLACRVWGDDRCAWRAVWKASGD